MRPFIKRPRPSWGPLGHPKASGARYKGDVQARKPSSVLYGHSSGTPVTGGLEPFDMLRALRPTRHPANIYRLGRITLEGFRPWMASWSCSPWGLPCRPCHQGRGELLPRRFTLTLSKPTEGRRIEGLTPRQPQGGLFSVALSVPVISKHGRGLGVTQHGILWSSDFPPRRKPAERPFDLHHHVKDQKFSSIALFASLSASLFLSRGRCSIV